MTSGERRGDPRTGSAAGSGAGLLGAALTRRPAAAAAPPYAVAFAAQAAVLDRVLAELTAPDWERTTPVEGWTVRELVSHLAALDGVLAADLGLPVDPAPRPADDPVSRTVAVHRHHHGWPPSLVWPAWHDGARAICTWLAGREPDTGSRPVRMLGMTASIADQLTARAFETWIHARDIAGTVGLRVPPPRAGHLSAMADLALRLLGEPARAAARGMAGTEPAGDGALLVTLTGDGGGRWRLGPDGVSGADEATSAAAGVRLDAVAFCLLVGDRLDPGSTGAERPGDPVPGRALLTTAPTLAHV